MTDANNGGRPGGPDAPDWFTREASEGLRRMFGQFVESQVRGEKPFWDRPAQRPATDSVSPSRPAPAPDGDGVWAIVSTAGGAVRVEELFAGELDALRANQHNVDPDRSVRFLRYGSPIAQMQPGSRLD
ncbi:hypothetical protein [Gordonia zhaorongruii]|uniref:hypothetical protein n=1 Tax=Gordonia zhaorongruii TaxID=2597659 RepID=UPI001045030B|nr:hypothetical protein [Gordonia zhaorongruii]